MGLFVHDCGQVLLEIFTLNTLASKKEVAICFDNVGIVEWTLNPMGVFKVIKLNDRSTVKTCDYSL